MYNMYLYSTIIDAPFICGASDYETECSLHLIAPEMLANKLPIITIDHHGCLRRFSLYLSNTDRYSSSPNHYHLRPQTTVGNPVRVGVQQQVACNQLET